MKPDEKAAQAEATARPAPPDPRGRPQLFTTNGTLLGHVVLHSATWHRPR
ncbi:hypothetical protein [Nocardia pneumoniae]|nr:hypothetical protein [Nocardia pneumoniae]